jgi:cytochrome c oxidase subunit II
MTSPLSFALALAAPGIPAPTDTSPGNFWMPQTASTTAHGVDALFYGILALSTVCFVGITVAVIWFVMKYRHRPGHNGMPSPDHNDALEITWTVIPTIIVAIVFVLGWKSFADLHTPPKHALEIQVTGQKWSWQFQYPNGHVDNVLHVPVDQSVRLVMTAQDVLHSFFVPAFRVKQDVLPQRYTSLWFHADKPGTYRVYCAEYCGQQHSEMKTVVVVHESGGYEKYLEEARLRMMNMPPRELGELVYNQRGCNQCHSTDGAASTGPTFKGIFGAQHTMTDGSQVAVDENYIRESVLEPQSKIRSGFNPVMPTFKGKLHDKEITGLIEYIKSLE